MSEEHLIDPHPDRPEGATHLANTRPPEEEISPEELVVMDAGSLTAKAAIPDPTDKIMLSPNYTPGWSEGAPMGVTVHTEEGYHDPSVSWLRNPASRASAHFCVRRDGYIVQLVYEQNRAWHAQASGMYMFGIEHEGGSGAGSVPILWTTSQDAATLRSDDAMLKSSAGLTAYLCSKHSIEPKHVSAWNDRTGPDTIAGHSQMAGNDHVDPYSHFPWKAYMAEVKKLIGGEPTPPKPEKPEKPTSDEAEVIDRYFGTGERYGRIIVKEADRAGLALQAACALVEQESNGRNIFGCDHGAVGDSPPYCHQPVTKERVAALRRSGQMNGVGLTQLTWHTFVTEAENMGGAHLPRYQCRVGFKLLADYFGKYGGQAGFAAYNAGEANRMSVYNTYGAACIAKRDAWARRLA